MRRTAPAYRVGISVAAAVVLLAGCGGSGNDTSASSSSRTSTSKTSAPAAGSEFCTQAAAALSEIEPAFTGQSSDPTALAPALQKAADEVRAIHPPSQIAYDWAALADGIQQFAQAFASVNLNDPASATQLQQRTNELIGSLSTSATHVETYLSSKCGLVAPTQSAAPTS
jgi:hypothetical protein